MPVRQSRIEFRICHQASQDLAVGPDPMFRFNQFLDLCFKYEHLWHYSEDQL